MKSFFSKNDDILIPKRDTYKEVTYIFLYVYCLYLYDILLTLPGFARVAD